MENLDMAILHENTVKAIGKDNDVAQAAFDKYVDAVCVKISQAVNECWQEKSRQLTTEAVNLSNRLLATKFVADEAAGLVKELGRALKNIAGFDHFISEEKARGVFIANVYPAIAKATQFTAAIAPTAPAVGAPTEPQILPPVDAVPEYVPDWPGIPEPFDHVAVDEDGRVFCFVGCPERRPANGVWYPMSGQYKDVSYITEIPEPPGDTWKQMIYQRPK